MANIASKIAWFQAVPGSAKYNIRVLPQALPFDYNHPAHIVLPHDDQTPEYEVDLAGLGLAEGVYNVHITAIDAAGNESDPLVLADAVLDFTPPSAPAAGGFR